MVLPAENIIHDEASDPNLSVINEIEKVKAYMKFTLYKGVVYSKAPGARFTYT